jgi:pilus assembly protein Flp/PilA
MSPISERANGFWLAASWTRRGSPEPIRFNGLKRQRIAPISRTRLLFIFTSLQLHVARVRRREEGQGLTEYALILALIAVVAVVALKLLGARVTSVLSSATSSL